VGMQIGLDTYARRREHEAAWRPLVKRIGGAEHAPARNAGAV